MDWRHLIGLHPDGGGGSGGGSGNPDAGGGASENGALNQTQIVELINETVNKALGPRLKRFENSILESVEKGVGDLLADRLPDGEGKKPAAGDDKDNPLAKQVQALTTKLQEAEAKELNTKKRAALAEALEGSGMRNLPKALVDGLLAGVEESGGEFFVGDKSVGDYAKDYAKGEGRVFIPARGGGGSGHREGDGDISVGGDSDDPNVKFAEAVMKDMSGMQI